MSYDRTQGVGCHIQLDKELNEKMTRSAKAHGRVKKVEATHALRAFYSLSVEERTELFRRTLQLS
ncbi:hypothetical protein [Vibrio chagasii]|uniref:hypothetical protein n=1 Tax=Vibrio chagasii TaxID=170679 RepID=UPI0022849D63|nr:hypothetical protein [Vibrio chagasii]MCY9828845.1 hypothetical protein [Vibrio chagasii]